MFDTLPSAQKQIYFDVFGETLRDFLAITYHCDALIGNEGGAINMAKALNVPTFTIFSPWIKKEASFCSCTTCIILATYSTIPSVILQEQNNFLRD